MAKVQVWGEIVNGRFIMQDEKRYRDDMRRMPDGPARLLVHTWSETDPAVARVEKRKAAAK